jgi:predicted O-linked N-acetylglucosamine transferase (SPINDLY family)
VKKAAIADQFAQAVRHHAAGRLAEAGAGYRLVLARDETHAASLHGLGVIAYQTGRPEIAVDLIGRALAIDPAVAAFETNLGNALKALGRLDQAAVAYRQALALEPADTVALNNLGNLLRGEGRLDEAVDCFRRALAHKPEDPVVHNNLGNAMAARGRFAEAARLYERALALRPGYAEAHYNLANLLVDQGQLDAAITRYGQALALRPSHLPARLNLGAALRQAGRLADAIACYEAVLAHHPDSAEAHSNLGRVFMLQGRLDEAVARYEHALALKPDYQEALANLLLWLQYSDRDPPTIFEAHRRWGEMVEKDLPAPAPHLNQRDPERRLRVGYVSPDFRTHSVAWFLAPLLASHDRQAVEIFGYADVARPDATTRRLRSLCDHWLPTVGLSDAALIERIRADGIDVLVDMAGHAGVNRLAVFARHPAPVQVDWLGYLNTTGLKAMDYRLVDDITDPPGEADQYATETLVRLPNGWACFEPAPEAPEPGPLPSLAEGVVRFCSFSSPAKLGERVLDAWSDILRRTPGSRVLLKGASLDDAGARSQILGRFADCGVAAERIELIGWIPGAAEHLALYNTADIALDPFPHNGVTTTCEALWMGVPVVALLGDRHAARISASFLTRVGLEELIAPDLASYADIAVRLASDTERLVELRRTLRPRMAASRLCDAPGFAREVEAAYRAMWRRWCAEGD